MHKKLADDLTSIAHSILRMKDKDDVFALKSKAHEIYEKLALLAYVEEYINTTPNAKLSKEELLAKVAEAEIVQKGVVKERNEPVFEISKTEEEATVEKIEFVEDIQVKEILVTDNKIEEELEVKLEVVKEEIVEVETDQSKIIEQPFDEIQELLFGASETEELIADDIEVVDTTENTEIVEETIEVVSTKIALEEEVNVVVKELEEPVQESTNIEEGKILTLEEELGDTISVDVMANLFEKVEPKKTLHDKLQNTITIDLNDRIAFVKHLFNGNQEDFNRVLSQLNTINSEKSAKDFIQKMIKPDYDWSEKAEYEVRLMEIIERKFIV